MTNDTEHPFDAFQSHPAEVPIVVPQAEPPVDESLRMTEPIVRPAPEPEPAEAAGPEVEPVDLWGLPLAPWTRDETLEAVSQLVEAGRPSYFITANLNYALINHRDPRVQEATREAAFVLADGMPMVWWSKWTGRGLPERVAGADLIYDIAALAADRGWPIYFLGGAPGVARTAAYVLAERSPGLKIAGIESPPFRPLSDEENADLVARIRRSGARLLFVAFGQPKGELWLRENGAKLGVPVSVQIGASLDFAAGRVRRAPRWMQRTGLEWLFRLLSQPHRLAPRYFANAVFLLKMVARDLCGRRG